ncbi:LOW QUALITY PROTEIN: glutamate receptor 2.3-like [Phalaenopsis equestris]|uniref:LOW QUALITY PROTEIN: glutamate receptor 2.3-like n=1 Tax=Phalaenopsis equestris TaxID=78828 RepID=UPI0009E3BB00|nr:LOW QUALITY PROTEIN: glutamate receptor 2.3-like [Phalaenopsis equestris]
MPTIDLLNNVKVKAIIGPQQSSQASFVMNLGDRARVPILSFSAKSPSLSSKQSSYFLRTAYNDSTQAKAIASIVKYFNWREVVLIYVDDEYGNGIMPYLINQFQHIDVRVPRRSSIPPSATESQILKELNKLKNMQTRVFVVHMTCELGLKFFKIAKEEGMLNEGYVWITTYGLTDVVNLMGSSAANVMQGVLGVRPLVNMTSKLRDFKQRWRKIFHEENPESNINEPIVFGLWAYDTVWALALAAEKVRMENFEFRVGDMKNSSNDIASIGSSSVGPKLLSAIQSTEFDGMAGRFRLIDGQLESQDIEIVNVVKNGSTRIGFWAPPNNVSGRRNSKDKLDVVVWPGGREGVPKGWEWPTAGNKLKIGVPVKPGFPEVIRVELDPDTNKRIPKGYCIDVFDAVMKNLTYAPYDYVLYEDGNGQMNGTYDDLVYQVYLQAIAFDAYNLVPKVVPDFVSSIELSKGDGGLGTVLKLNFTKAMKKFRFTKEKIEVLDPEKHVIKYTIIEGGHVGLKLKSYSISIEVRLEAVNNSEALVKLNLEYDTIENTPLSVEEEEGIMKDIVLMLKAIEGYLIENPTSYA